MGLLPQPADTDSDRLAPVVRSDFLTTRWSLVLRAGNEAAPGSAEALEEICRLYWYPIYAYVRRMGNEPPDAQDLTQEFFARLLRLKSVNAVAPQKGKFRTFLLVSLKHFLSDARDAAHAIKRGSGIPLISLDEDEAETRFAHELTTNETPEVLFDRRWMLAVLEAAFKKLEAEHHLAGQLERFEQLRDFLQNPSDDGGYNSAAQRLAMTPGAVAVAVHRLRQRYRDLVRFEIAETVASEEELADELRHLFGRARG